MRRVYLVTYGPFSKCQFLLESQIQDFIQSLPVNERRCALITSTDMDESDLDFVQRTQSIIEKHEQEATEARLNLEQRFKLRKRA